MTPDLPQIFKVNGSKVKIWRISIKKSLHLIERIAGLKLNFGQTIPEHSATRDTCSGHNVKYSNCNNSAADCPISLKFRTEFDRGEAGLLHMFKVKGQRSRSRGQSSGSWRNVTCQQEDAVRRQRRDWVTSNLARARKLKRIIGTAWRRAASSCNAFAIATFSSFCLCASLLANKDEYFLLSIKMFMPDDNFFK